MILMRLPPIGRSGENDHAAGPQSMPWGLALPEPANSALWEKPGSREFWVGKDPMVAVAAMRYRKAMKLLLLVIVLLLLFGGGGFYFGGPVIGGGGLGLVLVICLIVYFLGGFRSKAE